METKGLEVTEPRDAVEAREALDDWLDEWHALNPDEAHPLDVFRSLEWAETRPAELED